MGNYDESNIFVNREQEEDSNNDANLEMAENISSDKDNFSDIEMNNNLFNLNQRGLLTFSNREREINENRKLEDFFQDIDLEKFSNIFVEKIKNYQIMTIFLYP